jgi:hypothetical protein
MNFSFGTPTHGQLVLIFIAGGIPMLLVILGIVWELYQWNR